MRNTRQVASSFVQPSSSAFLRNASCSSPLFFASTQSTTNTRISTWRHTIMRSYSTEEQKETQQNTTGNDDDEEDEALSGSTVTKSDVKIGPAYKVNFYNDKIDPAWRNYHEVINAFMERLIHKQRLGYMWYAPPVAPEDCYAWVDETKFPDGVVRVRMASFAPDKIVRQVLIDFHNWKLKLQQVDLVDGSLSEERVIDVPADWLFAMKVMKWPGPDVAISQLRSRNSDALYAFAKERKELKTELYQLQDKVGELLEELKEDTAMKLV